MTEHQPELIEEIIDVDADDGTMAVIRKRRPGSDGPGIVMFHDGPGIRNATHNFARQLASVGYDVIVPDLYHRHGRMIGYELHEREADPTLVDHLWQLLESLDDREIQADLDAALAATGLGGHDQLGTIGFCVGARAVAKTMARRPKTFVAGAMWHPSYLVDDHPDSPHRMAPQLQGGLFIGLGAEDRQQPVSANQPFLDAVGGLPDIDIQIYDGADHGYTWEGWPSYEHKAATDSFSRTDDLFRRHLS